MYFLGTAGHFALGSSNSIATVDVAGAFMGHSSHSMVTAGILMFVITPCFLLLLSFGMIMSPGTACSELRNNLCYNSWFSLFGPSGAELHGINLIHHHLANHVESLVCMEHLLTKVRVYMCCNVECLH